MSRSNILTDDVARAQFIDACLALKAEPIGTSGFTFYDYFPHWHFQAMNVFTPAGQRRRNAAHGGPSFGPWHRLMLMVFEVMSRQVLGNNGFELPYWDFGADGSDPGGSSLWLAIGGDGNPLRGDAVQTGPFREGQFTVNLTDGLAGDWITVSRPLRRNFGWDGTQTVATSAEIAGWIRTRPSYELWPYDNSVGSFRRELEVPIHNIVHRFVGGDMMSSASPNDPVFFLHHANIDRIWAAWQAAYPNTPYVPQANASDDLLMHRINDTMHNYFGITLQIADVVAYQRYYDYDSLA